MNTEETIDPLGVVLRVDWALAQRRAERHRGLRPAGRRRDQLLTRRNDRRNRLSATDFVKNGDRWTVVEVGDRGGLRVRHQRSGKITWLGADYVRQHVDHAYAVTVHSAQGSTVDTAHVLVDGTEDRQTLYVALSRGRFGNHLYLRTAGDGDPHKTIRPEVVRPSTGAEILTGILERDGAGTLRGHHPTPGRIATVPAAEQHHPLPRRDPRRRRRHRRHRPAAGHRERGGTTGSRVSPVAAAGPSSGSSWP